MKEILLAGDTNRLVTLPKVAVRLCGFGVGCLVLISQATKTHGQQRWPWFAQVAELTFVRINDLAAPPEPIHPIMYLEPLVAVLIVGNGVMIGFQTDPSYKDWHGWPYVEIAFASFLVLEIFLRAYVLRCANYWCGSEKFWNWFDLFLAATGIADIAAQLIAQEKSDIAGAIAKDLANVAFLVARLGFDHFPSDQEVVQDCSEPLNHSQTA